MLFLILVLTQLSLTFSLLFTNFPLSSHLRSPHSSIILPLSLPHFILHPYLLILISITTILPSVLPSLQDSSLLTPCYLVSPPRIHRHQSTLITTLSLILLFFNPSPLISTTLSLFSLHFTLTHSSPLLHRPHFPLLLYHFPSRLTLTSLYSLSNPLFHYRLPLSAFITYSRRESLIIAPSHLPGSSESSIAKFCGPN